MSVEGHREITLVVGFTCVRLVAVGGSLAGVTLSAMLPSTGPARTPDLRCACVMVVLTSLSVAGVKLTAASAALTLACVPVTVHTPVPAV